MKTSCSGCGAKTPADGVAWICSEECTYCPACAPPSQRCPGCDGELQPRPRRGHLRDAPSMTAELFAAFEQAWGRADVDALAAFLTEDCVYAASVGEEPGTTYVGKDEVVRGIRRMLAYEKSITRAAAGSGVQPLSLPESPLFLHGHRGFAQWAYPQVDRQGRPCVVRGCDFFEFEGRLIRRKDAFIKTMPVVEVEGRGNTTTTEQPDGH